MQVELAKNEDGTYSGFVAAGEYVQTFSNQGAGRALDSLRRMFEEAARHDTASSERIRWQLGCLEIGKPTAVSTFGLTVPHYRVRVTQVTKKTGVKVKTKIIDGELIATRIA